MAFTLPTLPKSIDVGSVSGINDIANRPNANYPKSPLPFVKNVPTVSNFIDSLVSQYIVRPSPNNDSALITSEFVFSIITEHSIQDSADITDHLCENLDYIQDHIAHKPIIITLKGEIGEVVYKPSPTIQALKTANEKLLAINSYLPNQLTSGANQKLIELSTKALEVVNYIDGAVATGVGLYNMFAQNDPDPAINNQEKCYNKLRWLKRALILNTVITPFGVFEDMAIQDINMIQSDTLYKSSVAVTLKQVRQAKSKTTKYNPSKQQRGNKNAKTEEKDLGKTNGNKKGSFLNYATKNNSFSKFTKANKDALSYSKAPDNTYKNFINNKVF
jgi:hypothetical protein